MSTITLISPYFGERFPNTFPILFDSLKWNKDIEFIIPTNIDFSQYKGVSNVSFIKTSLSKLNEQINSMLGYHAHLSNAYKLVDFKPSYGILFGEYLDNSDWWGYFDMDLLFGNISAFLTDELLDSYDRIFTHGHLTLYRNDKTINNLWRYNFNLREVPDFHTVAKHKAIFAFDEWGWGKNRGRGLSYALHKKNIVRQFDNTSFFADINPNLFGFKINNGISLEKLKYFRGNLIGIDENNTERPYMYAHFQKRAMSNQISDYKKSVYITPNIFSNTIPTLDIQKKEKTRWIQQHKIQRKKQVLANLTSSSYIWRRLHFLFSEN